VLGDSVELFAAIRPHLESEMLQVWWGQSDDVPRLIDMCIPWPWGVAGRGPGATDKACQMLRNKPVLWFWLGDQPRSVPRHTRAHPRWRELAGDVCKCVSQTVGGVRLAPNRGLVDPAGELVLCPALEGLLSNTPTPMRLSPRHIRQASEAIERQHLPLRLRQMGGAAWLERGDANV
jgi:hypothetical protein